jgi:phospholipid N-methyltransferase
MSQLLFFKRVLANPRQVGYIVPSSPFLTRMTAGMIDFEHALTVVELGPGEGCHSRRILRRLRPDARLLLLELDPHFASHLSCQFADDPRVTVIQGNALDLAELLAAQNVLHPDCIVSGIPFTIMERGLRDSLIASIAGVMGPQSRFITYQATLQLAENSWFSLVRKRHCLFNVPPLFVLELRRKPLSES